MYMCEDIQNMKYFKFSDGSKVPAIKSGGLQMGRFSLLVEFAQQWFVINRATRSSF